MTFFSKKIKSELFKALKKEPNAFRKEDRIEFLNEIWYLRAMPSKDIRYKNALEDIIQHTINNDDWNIDYLFIDRLNLFENDKKFSKFLETIVNPKYRENEDEIIKFVLLINSYIEKENYILSVSGYDENDYSIYSIQTKTDDKIPIDLRQNKIHFYVIIYIHELELLLNDESKKKPLFVLGHNAGWNDFGFWTEFSLSYYGNDNLKYDIGQIKITDGKTTNTTEIIPDSFTYLTDNFCSLGQSFKFYKNLKNVAGKNFESILYAIKDAAFFPDIYDKFEKNNIFRTSLLRSDEAERLSREVRHKIYGYDLTNLYNFKYFFHPIFFNNFVEVDFNFTNDDELHNRIYAIIGKNGTGKTQLITSLPSKISQKKDTYFSPKTPLFSKIIAVSYSIFDDFEIPQKNSSFNYVYCGLYNIQETKKNYLHMNNKFCNFIKL